MKLLHPHAIFALALLSLTKLGGQEVHLRILEDRAVFTEGQDTVMAYQIRPKSMAGKWERAGYIHPLYSLDGAVLTEDFPEDHPHHRGVFWAWHQVFIGDTRIGDGWEIRDFSWEVEVAEAMPAPAGAASLQATVYWKSPVWTGPSGQEEPFVKETTQITVYPAEASTRRIEVRIQLQALEPAMRLGGSDDEKGYGGFSARLPLPEDLQFNGPMGAVLPENTPVASPGWVDITGSFGPGETRSGVVIAEDPGNPGYPNPWILRQTGSMQNAVYPHPGAVPVALPTDQPLVLRYLMLIHREHADIITPLIGW